MAPSLATIFAPAISARVIFPDRVASENASFRSARGTSPELATSTNVRSIAARKSVLCLAAPTDSSIVRCSEAGGQRRL